MFFLQICNWITSLSKGFEHVENISTCIIITIQRPRALETMPACAKRRYPPKGGRPWIRGRYFYPLQFVFQVVYLSEIVFPFIDLQWLHLLVVLYSGVITTRRVLANSWTTFAIGHALSLEQHAANFASPNAIIVFLFGAIRCAIVDMNRCRFWSLLNFRLAWFREP